MMAPDSGSRRVSASPVPTHAEEHRYSLPALLQEVMRDRESAAFAMEKLDQPTISFLFEHKRSLRETSRPQ